MSARDLINAGAASSAAATYVEDVFSIDTYTGNGLSIGYKDIVNNIPLNSSSAWWGAKWVGPTGGGGFGTRVTADPSGNVYVCGYVQDTFGRSFIAKYNSSGTLQWQRIVSEGSSFSYAQGITSDSSGNVYITGYATDTLQHAYVIKYNTSGTLQWHRKLQDSATRGRGIAVDSSGNVYVTGSVQSDSTVFTAKYNSSGTLQWQRYITRIGSEYAGYGVDIAADSSGNVYVTAQIDLNYTFSTILVLKYNTSGTLQWHRKAYQNSSYAGGIAVDSSGNVYIGGTIAEYSGGFPNNFSSGYIIKYNTNGTLQWQRRLRIASEAGGGVVGGGFVNGISVDSSGNSYVSGYGTDGTGGVSSFLGLIAKYNTSGTLQWQRHFRHGNGVNQNGGAPAGIYADSSNVYVTGSGDGSNSFGFVIKISQDGNTNGTVNGGTLSVGIATESAGTATDFAGTTTDTAGSATESAGTATDSAGTAISTTQVINAVDGGGLVWIKARTNTGYPIDHALYDSARGPTKELSSNLANEYTVTNGLTAFGANSFTIGAAQNINQTAQYVAWTFRKQPKFFDVVTWTGDGGTGTRTISHALGSVPGCVIAKCRSNSVPAWYTQHRSVAATGVLQLNTTDQVNTSSVFNNQYADSTSIYLDKAGGLNLTGLTYVAYLFAHDAGGFGASGTDNVISCGSFTTDGSGNASVTLGYEPQWVLMKVSGVTGGWQLADTMREMSQTQINQLVPNTSAVEGSVSGNYWFPTATGFTLANGWGATSQTYIYIAIRRGPMRTPTDATKVFSLLTRTGTDNTVAITGLGFAPDVLMSHSRSGGAITENSYSVIYDKMRGRTRVLSTHQTSSEQVVLGPASFDNDGITVQNNPTWGFNTFNAQYVYRFLRRAPGFFDVVCYTGNGSNPRTISHNLTVVPQLMIVKTRSTANSWYVYDAFDGAANAMLLENSGGVFGTSAWSSTTPTSSVFTIGSTVNGNNLTYVAYLFATVPGVSKVGSYTGNGSSQTINCGFTGGARFVLIKRTDSTGDWYVWDTARGIVSANDPHLSLNSTAAEVTTNDSIDPDSTGFVVNQVAATNVNVNAATYIYLAIA